jgi:DNA polymerase-3 subunit gamma/tau
MSYVVLARKYRPRRFAEMVGQEHVVQALTNALQQQRLHHAYLFTGTRGIGKTTVSRILAKSLNCTGADGQGGITASPCGVCQACTEIDADRYLDYIELDAASNRSIDEIRDLIERAAYKPGSGRFKVFMIDEAHQLTKDAFNALLKTLEEPPEYLKFVLATTDPEKMLPTVLSRCLQFNLRPMAPATVREHLARVLEAEAVPFDDGALRLLARAARGSMRDGLSLTDQAIAYGGGSVVEEGVRAMLGAVDRGHARALVEALARRDGAALLAGIDGLRSLGLSASGTLEELAQLAQQMAVEQAVPGALDAQDPDTADARALAPLLAADETQLLYSVVLHGREELQLMSDEYGALTMVLLRVLAFPAQDAGAAERVAQARATTAAATPLRSAALRAPAPPAITLPLSRPQPAAPVAAVPAPAPSVVATSTADARPLRVATPEPPDYLMAPDEVEDAPALPPAAATPPVTAVPQAVDSGELRVLGDRWQALALRLAERGALAALLRELAWQGGLQAIDDSVNPPLWRLRVERETLRNPALRDKLAAAMQAELGQPLQLELEPGVPADTPARRDAAERARRQAAAEAAIAEDPVVTALLSQFQTARIVPGSIKPA